MKNQMNLEKMNVSELNRNEMTEINGGGFWSWLGGAMASVGAALGAAALIGTGVGALLVIGGAAIIYADQEL
jgi:hypothetical protein